MNPQNDIKAAVEKAKIALKSKTTVTKRFKLQLLPVPICLAKRGRNKKEAAIMAPRTTKGPEAF